MIKKILLFSIIFSLISVLPLISSIKSVEGADGPPIKSVEDIINILYKIVNYMYTAFFIVAIMFIIMAAFTYLTAQDDAEKIKSATRQIMWAAVAIAVALISVGFNKIVENFLK